MKFRNGFVSNSSSSSFLIPINALKQNQIEMIVNHIHVMKNWLKNNDDKVIDLNINWNIDINDKCIYGYTFMDNFDMEFFLLNIANVEEKYIYWSDDESYDNDIDLDKVNREILQDQRKEKIEKIDIKKNNL